MTQISLILKKIILGLDYACLVLSPFALILVVVGALMLIQQGATLQRQLRQLADSGQRGVATLVSDYDADDLAISLAWCDDLGREHQDLVDVWFYPSEAYVDLRKGDRVSITYVPDDPDVLPVLSDFYASYRSPLKRFGSGFLVLAVSWCVVIVRPDILYLGLTKDYVGVIDRTIAL